MNMVVGTVTNVAMLALNLLFMVLLILLAVKAAKWLVGMSDGVLPGGMMERAAVMTVGVATLLIASGAAQVPEGWLWAFVLFAGLAVIASYVLDDDVYELQS